MISMLGNELADARQGALLAEAEEARRARRARASAKRPRVRWRAIRARLANADRNLGVARPDSTPAARQDETNDERPVAA